MTKFLPSQSTPSEQIIQSPYMQFLFILGQTCPESCPCFRKHCSSSAQGLRAWRPMLCGVHTTTRGCHSRLKGTSRALFPLIILPAKNAQGWACMHMHTHTHTHMHTHTLTHTHTHMHTHTGWLLLKGTRGLIFSHFDVTFYRISIFGFRAACFPTSGCRPGKSFFFPTITNKMPRFYGGRHCHTPAQIWANSGDSGG